MEGKQERKHEPLVTELHLPSILVVDGLSWTGSNIVGDDLHGGVLAHQLIQQRSDQWSHASREDDNWNIVLLCPVVEGLEARVQSNPLEKNIGALIEWRRDGVKHLLEGRAESEGVGQDLLVESSAGLNTHTEVVGQVVVGVGGGDGAIEIGEEDELWVGGHGGEISLDAIGTVDSHYEGVWDELVNIVQVVKVVGGVDSALSGGEG